ncbi:MAG: hypothetical protein ACK5T0_02475 [Vampirovibrionales bacterium]
MSKPIKSTVLRDFGATSKVNPSTPSEPTPTTERQQLTERQQPTPSSLTSLNLNQTRVWGDETPPPTTGSGGSVRFASTPERDPWDFPAVKPEPRKNLATPKEYKKLASEGKVPPEIDGLEGVPVAEWREFGAKGEVPPVIAARNERFAEGKGRPPIGETSDTTPV